MSAPVKMPHTAAEFLIMSAANALMNSDRVRAVMVIVALDPQPGGNNAPVVMNTWGGSAVDQATVLRELAAGIERAEVGAQQQPMVQ